MFNCAFRYVFVDLVFYKGLKLIPYCVDVIVVFLYECIKSSNDFSSLMLKHCSIQYTNFPFTVLCLVKKNSLFTLFSHSKQNWKYFSRFNHRGSQLYFHITRYVLKRRREDTFGGPKVKVVSAPFSLQKRFSLCSSHKINANIDVFCWLTGLQWNNTRF